MGAMAPALKFMTGIGQISKRVMLATEDDIEGPRDEAVQLNSKFRKCKEFAVQRRIA